MIPPWKSLRLLVLLFSYKDVCGPFPPPPELSLPMHTHPLQIVGGGPSNSYPRVIEALQLPVMGNFENATYKVMDDIKKGLQYLFQTRNNWTLSLTGGGSLAIEVVLDNLIEPGDVIFIPLQPYWGKRNALIAERLGAVVTTIEKEFGKTFSLAELEEGIVKHKPRIVYLTNAESCSCTKQRVEGVGEICRKYNCLLVVDVVATLGVIPFHMDLWKVDAVIANSQKAIGAPTGLAPISYGPRAIEKIMSRKTLPKIHFTDLKNSWIPINYWQMDPSRPTFFLSSYPVLQYYGMREALSTIANEGLENIWRRHEEVDKRLVTSVKQLGLKDFVEDPEDRLAGTLALHPPDGLNPKKLTDFVMAKYGLEFNIGMNVTYGKMIRLGLFGPNGNVETVDKCVTALEAALKHFSSQS